MINKRLMKEAPKATKYVYQQVFIQWLSLLCNILIVLTVSKILSMLFFRSLTYQALAFCVLILAVLMLVRMYLVRIQSLYSYKASKDIKFLFRNKIYRKLLEIRYDYRSNFSTSELVQLSVEGVDQLEIYFGRYLPQFFYSMLAPITLFIILARIDLISSLVLLCCVPLIPISIIVVQKIAKKLLSKYWTIYANLGDSFLENLQGLTTLKIYQADEFKHQQMNKEAENFRKVTMKVLSMQLNSITVMDIVAYGGAAIGSIVALNNYASGSISLFGVISIILLSAEFFLPLRLLGSYFHIAMNGIAASEKIYRLLDYQATDGNKLILDNQKFSIVTKNLSYGYDTNNFVLHNIDIEFNEDGFYGIVGESGSGKSTLAKVIMGMEKDYEGSVLVQNIERNELQNQSFYENVVYIGHQPFLIKGTVKDNLLIANDQLSDDEMEVALKKVNLYDFLQNQQGLDTHIEESGSNLSGGQKQRLSLAIALLKNAKCYIFDEATSNIDVESEECILSVIKELSKQCMVIMITHRLKSIKESDCIYVLENGRLVEKGKHDQLMNEKVYSKMYRFQEELEAVRGE